MARLSNCCHRLALCCGHLFSWRQIFIVILTPVILLPLAVVFKEDEALQKSMKCAYVLLIMIVYWSTQALPIAVTALVPMVLYPLLSLVKASDLAPKYMDESNLAFIASVIVVDSIEQVGLHKRFALAVLLLLGLQPRWLLFGFMFVSSFIAMWLQNSVTTALMVPIVFGVTDELRKAIFGTWKVDPSKDIEAAEGAPSISSRRMNKPRKSVDVVATSMGDRKFRDMLLLAVAYSSSIGGVSTLIGTSSNLIMKQQVDYAYESKGCASPLNFFSWMIYAVPISVVFIVITWLVLLIRYYGPMYAFGCKPSPIDKHKDRIKATTRAMYDGLPAMGIKQFVVLFHVIAMVLLMMTRQINTNPPIGWDVIAPGYAKESTAAVLVAVSLYVFPISFPHRDESEEFKEGGWRKGFYDASAPTRRRTWHLPETAVTWAETVKTIPLGVIILVGGGTAAAYGAEASGFAQLLSDFLGDIVNNFTEWQTMCLLSVVMVYVTEFMSNTACVSIMMPVFRYLAEKRGVNPLFYMFPTTVAASFAFMFPVATPPNAEVFHAGSLRLIDMISVGFFLNMIGIGLVIGATLSYGNAYFNFYAPPWKIVDLGNNQTSTEIYCT